MASGTFHWTADYVLEEQIGYVNNIIEYESGKERRTSKHAYARRGWVLNFRDLTETQFTDMEAFFRLYHGAHNTFNWTNPIDDTSYVARFSSDTFTVQRVTDNVYNITVTLQQVNE